MEKRSLGRSHIELREAVIRYGCIPHFAIRAVVLSFSRTSPRQVVIFATEFMENSEGEQWVAGRGRIVVEKPRFPTKIWWKPTGRAMAPVVNRTSDERTAGAMSPSCGDDETCAPGHPSALSIDFETQLPVGQASPAFQLTRQTGIHLARMIKNDMPNSKPSRSSRNGTAGDACPTASGKGETSSQRFSHRKVWNAAIR